MFCFDQISLSITYIVKCYYVQNCYVSAIMSQLDLNIILIKFKSTTESVLNDVSTEKQEKIMWLAAHRYKYHSLNIFSKFYL